MKKGKSSKLKGYEEYRVTYGTVDSKNLKSIYLNLQTWVKPKMEIENPRRVVGCLSKRIKYKMIENINKNIFKENFIVDLDLRSSGIQYNKKSFMNLECFFYTNNLNLDVKSPDVKDSIKKIVDSVIFDVLDKNESFAFSLTKN
jgi:hypothetical protein